MFERRSRNFCGLLREESVAKKNDSVGTLASKECDGGLDLLKERLNKS
jgi:hypothetical protein